MVLPLVVGGVMAAGALAKGVGGIMAGNKSANAAMDAAGAQVGAAGVAGDARVGAYDTARGLSDQAFDINNLTLRQILDMNRSQFRANMAEQGDAYGDIRRQNRNAFRSAQGQLNPLVQQGNQYNAALLYNDGLGERPDGYAEFTGTPGYEFRRGEAQNQLNNRLAAMGSLNSGAAVREAMRVADGMASQEHQLHYNRLAAGANRGDQARYALVGERNRLAANNTAARANLSSNRANLRSGYAANQNAARTGYASNAMNILGNQQNLALGRGEALARRATDAANAYASGRMGAVQGQTQAIQTAAALPGNMANAFMSGASMGMGGGLGGMLGGMFGGGGSSFMPGQAGWTGGNPNMMYNWQGAR